ncbi:MAG: carbohydrate kinase family protein [Planctomycetota bacterium]
MTEKTEKTENAAQTGKTAVVAGHICLDVIPAMHAEGGDALLSPGVLVECGAAVLSTGGAVSNVGLALDRLGVPVRLAGRIGDDLFGRGILDLLRARGEELAAGMSPVPGAASSYTVVINPPGRDRTFLHCPGANDEFGSDDVPDSALEGADLLHFGYPPIMRRMYSDGGTECAGLLRRARASGLTTSLDMSLPDADSPSGRVDWRKWLENVLPETDVFLPSVEELLFMLDRGRFEELESRPGGVPAQVDGALLSELSARLLDMGAAVAAVKLGDRGLYARTSADPARLSAAGSCAPGADWASRELYSPCFEVKVAGTTGSGDCTIAGFLAGLMRGLPPEETLRSAVAVGACSVEVPDATGGVRGWEEVRARLAAGWPRLELTPELPGWRPGEPAWTAPGDGGAK